MLKRDLTGERFSRLLVIRVTPKRHGRHVVWECACDCGQRRKITSTSLLSGATRSCGCLKSEIIKSGANWKHGEAVKGKESPEYRVFKSAQQRCENPANEQFHRYGGRGIEFKFKSLTELLACIGRRPSPSHTLDRINNDGHYEIGNIRWATRKVQANNRHHAPPRSTEQRLNMSKAITAWWKKRKAI